MNQISDTAPTPWPRGLVHEDLGGEAYDYYPLSRHVVVAPKVCGGRPTFKYTRLEVGMVLARIAAGDSIQQVVDDYALSGLTVDAVSDAIQLADRALSQSWNALHPAA